MIWWSLPFLGEAVNVDGDRSSVSSSFCFILVCVFCFCNEDDELDFDNGDALFRFSGTEVVGVEDFLYVLVFSFL